MKTFLGRAHAASVRGDRILRIVGHVRNKWYHDDVLTYVNAHQHDICYVTEDSKDQITVVMLRDTEGV